MGVLDIQDLMIRELELDPLWGKFPAVNPLWVMVGHGDASQKVELDLILIIEQPGWESGTKFEMKFTIFLVKRVFPCHDEGPHVCELSSGTTQPGYKSSPMEGFIGMGRADQEGTVLQNAPPVPFPGLKTN
ncbi:MAG: hypothetical protein KGY39_05350 [Anaerolineales bacterium]|nr:hypothetical protein [Anaerolineales bacterium]